MFQNFDLKKIKNSNNPKIINNELLNLISYYFQNGRPKNFIKYERELEDYMPKIMSNMNFEELMYIVPNYYQFCYTVTIEDNYEVTQNKISNKLLVPFSKILIKSMKKLNLTTLNYETLPDRYIIICRHATTKGMYAPGGAIYSITSGLLNQGKKVILLTIGNIDKQFLNLNKKNNDLTIVKNETNTNATNLLFNLRKICKNFKPSKIITEMPVNIGTPLYFSKIKSKVLYWSPGFTRVPWFDKILLVPELHDKKFVKDKKFVQIPKSLNFDLLNPEIKIEFITSFKDKNYIREGNFILGTFARYEKISEPFLKLVSYLLDSNKNRKIIIAGTNDNSTAKKMLRRFILNKQAIVLGFSDIHILGNCCNVFLDTIPFPCGFSAIEIMAKGKPVVSIKHNNLQNYKNSRVDNLILENEEKLDECLNELEKNSVFYDDMSRRSISIAKNYDNSNEVAKVINNL